MDKRFGNKNAFKHGGCPNRKPSPEYQSWYHMKDRCLNPNSDHWSMYGERGIKVCKRWLFKLCSGYGKTSFIKLHT